MGVREAWVVVMLAEAAVASPELLQEAGNGFDLVLNDALKDVSGIGLLPVVPPNRGDCPPDVVLSEGPSRPATGARPGSAQGGRRACGPFSRP